MATKKTAVVNKKITPKVVVKKTVAKVAPKKLAVTAKSYL
jgi:hypothetical protein